MWSWFFFLSVITLFDCAMYPEKQSSFVLTLEYMTLSMVFMVNDCGLMLINIRRQTISHVILVLNKKSLAIAKDGRFRNDRNRIQLISIGIFLWMAFSAFNVCSSLSVRYFTDGRVIFYSFFLNIPVVNLLEHIFHDALLLWQSNHLACYIAMLIEIFLRISMNYNVLGVYLQDLDRWEDGDTRAKENIKKFKFIMSEIHDLQDLMVEINGVISNYCMIFIALTINTTGLFMANMANAETIMEIVKLLPLSLWQIGYLTVLCILGEMVKEAVNNSYCFLYSA